MTEPITVNRSLIVPNTGDLAGAWGTAALNPNFQMIDTLFGGVTTISLTGATTLALTVPATTGIWPGGNPSQSSNSLIVFTGAQTGAAVIQFTLPGYYIVHNKCTGTTSIQLSPTGAGNKIGAPQGQKIHVFFDGTDMDYVNQPTPGSALDLHGWTALPPWMNVCTVLPYLIKDGTVYSTSTYPALFAALGSTFGGNGITTFAVPDEGNRVRLAIATSGVGRITFAVAGFTGSLMGAAGGDQKLQQHTHTTNESAHNHSIGVTALNQYVLGGGGIPLATNNPGVVGVPTQGLGVTNTTTTGITINNSGTGTAQNVQPSIVSFLPLIKT